MNCSSAAGSSTTVHHKATITGICQMQQTNNQTKLTTNNHCKYQAASSNNSFSLLVVLLLCFLSRCCDIQNDHPTCIQRRGEGCGAACSKSKRDLLLANFSLHIITYGACHSHNCHCHSYTLLLHVLCIRRTDLSMGKDLPQRRVRVESEKYLGH